MELTTSQLGLVESSLSTSTFLAGPAGSGKTTVGVERLNYLLQQGISGNEILILTPQRNLGMPYRDLIRSLSLPGGSLPALATFGGLARRYIDLFWPILQDRTGKFSLSSRPIFLTLESTLYFMASIVEPLITKDGLFSSVTIQRNRLYSQILDNLNKAAVHGFSHLEISEKLKSSWIGDPIQAKVFDDAQLAANMFRDFCLKNNLLDYSLQIELFTHLLFDEHSVRDYLHNHFNHLIYDNCEEDIPVCHDFTSDLMQSIDTSLIIFDTDAGYRHFLGASPTSAFDLRNLCQQNLEFNDLFVSPPEIVEFNSRLLSSLKQTDPVTTDPVDVISSFASIQYQQYLPELASWISIEIDQLLKDGNSPEDIVILSPYLSDTLRFVLVSELEKKDIPTSTHRPSRALREEPAVTCLLTLAALAHPEWKIQPSVYEISSCLMQSLSGLDLTRASLLAKQIRPRFFETGTLIDFDSIPSDIQERVTFFNGSKYQILFDWIKKYQESDTVHLDHFLILLFGEILSQPGYGFHDDHKNAEIAGQIIDSIKKFRDTAGQVLDMNYSQLGSEYCNMVRTGILANQYLSSWDKRNRDSVFISPAYTYLLSNFPVKYQFWIDVGSRGWYERIYQPLTNPHILHRFWDIGKPWTDSEEYEFNLKNLAYIITGLSRRCQQKIYFCLAETDERGFEQKGLLIQAINDAFRSYSKLTESNSS